jgi:DNA (cytosine-5)-methyltransferase 1
MTIVSTFSGIGGLEHGLERAGLGPVVWQCEYDPWRRSILEKHWPGVPRTVDIRLLDYSAIPRATVVCGGAPCQDNSDANTRTDNGGRQGLDGAKSGLEAVGAHRAARALGPRVCLCAGSSARL